VGFEKKIAIFDQLATYLTNDKRLIGSLV